MWASIGQIAQLLREAVVRLWPRSRQPTPTSPPEAVANPVDVAIAVSSYDAAKRSSEAAERGK
jgi:hypothetical protein